MLRMREVLGLIVLLGFYGDVGEAGHGPKACGAGHCHPGGGPWLGGVPGPAPGPGLDDLSATSLVVTRSYPVMPYTFGFPAAPMTVPGVSTFAAGDCGVPIDQRSLMLMNQILDRYTTTLAPATTTSLGLDDRLDKIETRLSTIEDYLTLHHNFVPAGGIRTSLDGSAKGTQTRLDGEFADMSEITALLTQFQQQLEQQLSQKFGSLDESVGEIKIRLDELEQGHARRDKALRRLRREAEEFKRFRGQNTASPTDGQPAAEPRGPETGSRTPRS